MLFFTGWKRRRLLRQPIGAADYATLANALWQSKHYPSEIQQSLIRWCRVFIAEKYWEGCDGLSVSSEMQWKIAAQAANMMLSYPDWYFDRTATVLIYPQTFVSRHVTLSVGSIAGHEVGIEGSVSVSGMTGYRRPVTLSWNDVQLGSRDDNDGHSLVVHEFAHQLDLINGPSADGLPPLPREVDEQKWWSSFKAELEVARAIVAEGNAVLIDDYGLSQPSEFFAVASEIYFQSPFTLAHYHPTVYELLLQFYRFDARKYLPR